MGRRLDKNTEPLFEEFPNDNYRREWMGMPEFEHGDDKAFHSITMHFASEADMDAFAKLIGQNITRKTLWLWHPKLVQGENYGKRYVSDNGEPKS